MPELETRLEDRCVAKVEAAGGMALKLQIPGVRGFPDRSCFLPARASRFGSPLLPLFFIEVKRMRTGKVSAQQERWAGILRGLGYDVYFIDNDAAFDAALEEWL